MDDELWMMAQQSRSLQDLRGDVGMVWNDSASQYLNGRYFDHHHVQSETMQESLAQRQHAEEQANNELNIAAGHGRIAEAKAQVVRQLVRAAEQDMELVVDEYGQYVTYEERARETSQQSEVLLRQLNQLQ